MNIHTPSLARDHLTAAAHSVITYANTAPNFASWLHSVTLDYTNPILDVADLVQPLQWRALIDDADAYERTNWLLREIAERPHSSTTATRAQIATWRQYYESPKDLVIGLVGVAVIGPTLGIIKRSPRQQLPMRVLVSHTLATASTATLTEYIQGTSMDVLAQELRRVGGNGYRLEPDLAEWCFGAHDTKAFATSQRTITTLAEQLAAAHLPHTVRTREGHPTALAIAPCVSDTMLEGVSLQPLNKS